MFEGIMIGSECADWWEKHIADYKKDLGDYVERHPGNFAVAVATAGATAADLGDVFIVDLLRLGEGAAEGSASGIAHDVFRLMTFIPEGRVLKAVGGIGRAKRAVEAAEMFRGVKGEICVPISIAQAIKIAGYKMAVGLSKVAEALNVDLKIIEEEGVGERLIAPALKKLGLVFDTIRRPGAKTFQEIAAIARQGRSPLMVGLTAAADGHQILIAETSQGMRIIDREGVFESLEALNRHYGIVFAFDAAEPFYMIKNALLDEKLLSTVNSMGVLACLARMSVGILDFNHSKVTPAFVKRDFENFLRSRGKTPPAPGKEIHVKGGKTVVVKHGDTLSGIAQHEYGSPQLWPLIYDLNKEKIGANPNLIHPGLHLLIRPLATYTGEEIAAARHRAPSWKAHSG